MTPQMTLERLAELLTAYGADAARWPEAERDAALALIEGSATARMALAETRALDALLAHDPAPPTLSFDAATLARRVMSEPRFRPKPRRSAGNDSTWRLAFGWMNFAGLAAAAVVGFVVGWSELDAGLGLGPATEAHDALSGLAYTEDAGW